VGEVLKDLIDAIERNMEGTQHVIIIDDGSSDKTDAKLTRLLRQRRARPKPSRTRGSIGLYELSEANLHLIISIWRFDKRRGLNFAFLRGYKEALKKRPEFIIKLDSDGKHDAYKFPKLLERIMEKPTEYKLVLMKDQDGIDGAGFRLITLDAIERIIDRLERFANEKWKKEEEWELRARGFDRKTKRLIEREFGNNAIARAY
jgi:glycosyltransferase involved in cell wall biosynthesis